MKTVMASISSHWLPIETAPTVTVTGADKGTVAGTASINSNGTLDVSFSGTATGTGNLTVSISSGVIRAPTNLTNLGSHFGSREASYMKRVSELQKDGANQRVSDNFRHPPDGCVKPGAGNDVGADQKHQREDPQCPRAVKKRCQLGKRVGEAPVNSWSLAII